MAGVIGLDDSHAITSKRSASPLFVSDHAKSEKRVKVEQAEDDAAEDGDGDAADLIGGGQPPTTDSTRPSIAIYHPYFHRAESEYTDLCDELTKEVSDFAKQTGYRNRALENIISSTLPDIDRPQTKYPTIGAVALVGSAGVGKSSTFNCLLDNFDAAMETDGGRGTYVVTEHSKALLTQGGKHEVTLVYMSRLQIEQHVGVQHDYVKAYMQHKGTKDDDEDEEAEEVDPDEVEAGFESAVKFFTDLLGDKRHFRAQENIRNWFQDRFKQSKSKAKIVQELMAYIDEYTQTRERSDDTEVIPSIGDTSLSEKLLPVSRPRRNETSPWPILRRIIVGHVGCDLLDAGVTLADTPGVADTNLNVVNNTLKYFRGANTILLFAKHPRIEHSKEVNEQLRQCIAAVKSNHVKLVVTMIDAKKVPEGQERDELEPVARERLDSIDASIKQLRANLSEVKKRLRKRTSDSDFREFEMQKKKLNKQIRDARAALKQTAILIRCQHIIEAMKSRLRELAKSPSAPDLPIYFISNSQYKLHVTRSRESDDDEDGSNSDDNDDDAPFLDLESTGIPQLRQALYRVPGITFETFYRLSRIRLPAALHGMVGILTKAPLSRKNNVSALIKSTMSPVDRMVEEVAQAAVTQFRDSMADLNQNFEAHWKGLALQMIEQWEHDYVGSTLVAFCRKSGKHKPKRGVAASLNDELLNIIADDLAAALETFRTRELSGISTQVRNHADDLFTALVNALSESQDFQGADHGPFFEFIRVVRQRAMTDIDDTFKKLSKDVAKVFTGAVVPSQQSYVALQMENAWMTCQKLIAPKSRGRASKGPTFTALRYSALRLRVCGREAQCSLFEDTITNISKDLEERIRKWEVWTTRSLQDAARAIYDDFDRRFETTEVKTENPELEQQVLQIITKYLDRCEGSLAAKVQACKQYEETGIQNW